MRRNPLLNILAHFRPECWHVSPISLNKVLLKQIYVLSFTHCLCFFTTAAELRVVVVDHKT